jgi:hypothetical protein
MPTTLQKSLIFALLTVNISRLGHNVMFAGEPDKWLKPVSVSTSPNSKAFFSLVWTAPRETVVTPVSSGQVIFPSFTGS